MATANPSRARRQNAAQTSSTPRHAQPRQARALHTAAARKAGSALAAALLLAALSPAQANRPPASSASQLVTWTGLGDGQHWSDPANWSPAIAPNGPYDVVLGPGAAVTLDQYATVTTTAIDPTAELHVDDTIGYALVVTDPSGLVTAGAIDIFDFYNRVEANGLVTNTGTINVNGTEIQGVFSLLQGRGPAGFTGTGTLALGSEQRAQLIGGPIVTNGPEHTIRGAGLIRVALHNEGTLRADVSGQDLVLAAPYAHVNLGTIQAAGGMLRVDGTLTHASGVTFEIIDGGSVIVSGDMGSFVSGDGNILASNGSLLLGNASEIDITGDLTLANGGWLEAQQPGAGSHVAVGTFSVRDSVPYPGTRAHFTQDMTLTTTGHCTVQGGTRAGQAGLGCTPPTLTASENADVQVQSLDVLDEGQVELGGQAALAVGGNLNISSGGVVGGAQRGGGDATITTTDLTLDNGGGQGGALQLSGQMTATVTGLTSLTSSCEAGDRGCTPPTLSLAGTSQLASGELQASGGGEVVFGGPGQLVAGVEPQLIVAGTLTLTGGSTLYGVDDHVGHAEVGALLVTDDVALGGQLLLSGTMSLTCNGDATFTGSNPLTGLRHGRGCTPPSLNLQNQATVNVGGDLQLVGATCVETGPDSTVVLGGDFTNQTGEPQQFSWQGNLVMQPPGRVQQVCEAAGTERGPVPAGWQTNFVVDRLELAEGALFILRDAYDNDGQPQQPCGETLYVNDLVIQPDAVLTLDDCKLYCHTLVNLGGVETIGCGALVVVPMFGDFDFDGDVDLDDFAIFFLHFGGPVPNTGETTVPPDLDVDGDVDMVDYALFLGALASAEGLTTH